MRTVRAAVVVVTGFFIVQLGLFVRETQQAWSRANGHE